MDDSRLQIPLASLTNRERDILRLLSAGLTDSEIAEELVLTTGTVKWYNRQIYSKLDVRNRTQAILEAQRLRLLEVAAFASAARSRTEDKSRLPAPVNAFVGRNAELAELQQLLLTTRLITLTGPPGTGKTRLALEASRAVSQVYRDGAYFVSLASVYEPDLVINAIAQVLEVKQLGSEEMVSALKRDLYSKYLLLVLDNFEHLLPASTLVSELLSALPRLTILVTSRERLRLYGEHEFPIPPLRLPDLKNQPSIDATLSSEAVELFVQRARATLPAFALDATNAAAVASICVHVDGLPLAIELAAARIKFYAPQTLLVRLGSRLEALNEGPRDLPARQRTLRSTLAWSFDLLDEHERSLFSRLGSFAGAFTTQDVQAVCGDGLHLDVAEGLNSLVNKSLLQQGSGTTSQPHLMMLETMREYALEKLDEIGETAPIFERHAHYYLARVEKAAEAFYGPEEIQTLIWLDAQHDNLRVALKWSLTTDPTGQMALRFIASLSRFWELRGYFTEGRDWLSQALHATGAKARTKALADALHRISALAYSQCDYAATQTWCEEALTIYQSLNDERNAALTLISLGEVATEIGDYDTAPALFQKAHRMIHQLGDASASAKARALTQLGFGALRAGDYDRASAWLEEGLAHYEAAADKAGTALACSGLGEIAVRRGDLDQAMTFLERSVSERQELHYPWGIAASIGSLAWVALLRGDWEKALRLLNESLTIRSEIGDKGGSAWCLEKVAEIAHLHNDDGRAARLLGAAASIRASVHSVVDPVDQNAYDKLVEQIRAGLAPDIFEAVWAEGAAMSVDHVLVDVRL